MNNAPQSSEPGRRAETHPWSLERIFLGPDRRGKAEARIKSLRDDGVDVLVVRNQTSIEIWRRA